METELRGKVWLEPFELKSQLVSNAVPPLHRRWGSNVDLWMSEGWAMRQQQGWEAPRYWRGTGARHGRRSSPSPDDGSSTRMHLCAT